MSGTLLLDLHASLLRVTKSLSTEIAAVTGQACGALYFDAYADDDTLPAGDHVGLSGLTFNMDSHIVEGSFMLGFTTQTDKNLFRLMKGVNHMLSKLVPGMSLEVVDAATGEKAGFISLVDDTKMMPVAGKVARPIQMIGVNFITTLDYQPEE